MLAERKWSELRRGWEDLKEREGAREIKKVWGGRLRDLGNGLSRLDIRFTKMK